MRPVTGRDTTGTWGMSIHLLNQHDLVAIGGLVFPLLLVTAIVIYSCRQERADEKKKQEVRVTTPRSTPQRVLCPERLWPAQTRRLKCCGKSSPGTRRPEARLRGSGPLETTSMSLLVGSIDGFVMLA